jgi:hypothetical protein
VVILQPIEHPTCRCYWAPGAEDLKAIYWTSVDISPRGLTDYERGRKCRKCGQKWHVIGMSHDAAGKEKRLF